jgi:hypothetical protein
MAKRREMISGLDGVLGLFCIFRFGRESADGDRPSTEFRPISG